MRVCFVTSECVPFVKTGGLADVSGALPKALAAVGAEVKVFLPLYGSIRVLDHDLVFATEFHNAAIRLGHKTVPINVWYKQSDAGVEYYFIDQPHYFHRPALYTTDWDEDERFLLLQEAVIHILQVHGWPPDIIHCNDWPAALLPVFIKEKYGWDQLFAHTGSVLSVHNIGYQGKFGVQVLDHAALPRDKYYPGGPFEFYGSFCFLKAGLVYADLITTVSPTHAQEIQTWEYGAGLAGVLAQRREDLVGILNGIDTTDWNPCSDRLIPHPYGIDDLDAKLGNKQALMAATHLPYQEEIPAVGLIARLVHQKGVDLLAAVFQELMQLPLQLVVLGSGEAKYEDFLRWATHTYPDKVHAHLGFNNALAHLITAGCDMLLIPSLYEPCGLNQMYSLNYGTVPVVRRTGGLADTVRDYHENNGSGNGFVFRDFDTQALWTTMQRALQVYAHKDHWRELMKRGMQQDFSWHASALKYLEVYQRAQSKRA